MISQVTSKIVYAMAYKQRLGRALDHLETRNTRAPNLSTFIMNSMTYLWRKLPKKTRSWNLNSQRSTSRLLPGDQKWLRIRFKHLFTVERKHSMQIVITFRTHGLGFIRVWQLCIRSVPWMIQGHMWWFLSKTKRFRFDAALVYDFYQILAF
jgi:hypothetical protein